MTEGVGSSVGKIDGRVGDARGSDGSSTGVMTMPASRTSSGWWIPGGESGRGGVPGSGNECVGSTAGAMIAGPGVKMGSLGEVSVTADDRLEVGRVPTEDGGLSLIHI